MIFCNRIQGAQVGIQLTKFIINLHSLLNIQSVLKLYLVWPANSSEMTRVFLFVCMTIISHFLTKKGISMVLHMTQGLIKLHLLLIIKLPFICNQGDNTDLGMGYSGLYFFFFL